MKILVYVFLGSAFGAVIRYLVSKINISKVGSYNIGATFIVNIVGCFILGLTFRYLNENIFLYALLGTGICGGLSTFSTFNSELVGLIYERNIYTAIRYGMFSYGIGLIFCLIGYIV